MEISIYGTGTAGTQMIRHKIEEYLNKASIAYNLNEIHDIAEIIAKNITSVPAVIINEEELIEIRKGGHYNASLRNLIQKLLKSGDYGTMPKILVPTDFSHVASNACGFAHKLSDALGAVVLITHIYYPVSSDINGHVIIDEKDRLNKKQLLQDTVSTMNKDWIGEVMETSLVDGIFESGFPAPTIIQIGAREKVDWIVMGSTGEGQSFKSVFGSVSIEIMEKGDIPVFLIPKDVTYQHFSKIVFATSDPHLDIPAALFLTRFAKIFNSHIYFLHVSENGEDWVLKHEFINAITNHYPKSQLQFESVHGKEVSDAIEKYAEQIKANLVVLSKRKRSILESLLKARIKKKLKFKLNIPLLVIPEGYSRL